MNQNEVRFPVDEEWGHFFVAHPRSGTMIPAKISHEALQAFAGQFLGADTLPSLFHVNAEAIRKRAQLLMTYGGPWGPSNPVVLEKHHF